MPDETTAAPEEPIRAKWVGDPTDPTSHHYGIPARDLTDAEYRALDREQRLTVRVSKLYAYDRPSPRSELGRQDAADDEALKPGDSEVPDSAGDADQPAQVGEGETS